MQGRKKIAILSYSYSLNKIQVDYAVACIAHITYTAISWAISLLFTWGVKSVGTWMP